MTRLDVLDHNVTCPLQIGRVKTLEVDLVLRVLNTTFFGESINFAILDPIDVGDGAKVENFHRGVTSSFP